MYLKRKSIKENRLRLQEGVSADNTYLPIGLDKYKKNTSAKGIVISVRDKDGEHELNKLYKTDDDLKKLIQEIERKYPTYYDISAIHDRNLIQAFENSVEEYKNKPKQKYTSAQLNKMRQNNSKILKAAKEAGIDISKLTSERTDKNGKSYRAASPELNKLRKNLYGESLKADNGNKKMSKLFYGIMQGLREYAEDTNNNALIAKIDKEVEEARREEMSLSESVKQDNEWEEVASKIVEDTDGFMTDYVWYTNGDKHVFVFGDSEIYKPEDGDYDWEVDVIEGKEAESYREAQDWFNSYE